MYKRQLYYTIQKEKPVPDAVVEHQPVEKYDIPSVTTTTHNPIGARASNDKILPSGQKLFSNNKLGLFGDRKELYYSILEDNFSSLSTDDKLLVMYKTFIIKNNDTNNYILMCLAVLIIILLKLFSK